MFEKLILAFFDILIFLPLKALQNFQKMTKNGKKSQNFDFEPPEMSQKIKISKKAQIRFSNML